jgi:hypothetical protein
MFAQVLADFEDRAREVDLYFQLLSALDNDELVVSRGSGPQVVPEGNVPADWDSMLKGSAYLVLYNLVEAFVRRGFQAVFDSIKSDGLIGVELTEVLRKQWVMQRNKRVTAFDGSPRVYMDIALELIGDIIAKNIVRLHRDHLPMSGNLDGETIRELCARHGVDQLTSAAAHGGSALTIVRQKRNSLAHGDESFAECGRLTTATQLVTAKDEIVSFMRDILGNMKKFADSKQYKAPVAI